MNNETLRAYTKPISVITAGPHYINNNLILSESFCDYRYTTPIDSPALAQELRLLNGQRIHQVFCLWERDDGAWFHEAPFVLRLDSCDIAVGALHGELTLWIGHIDFDATPLWLNPYTLEADVPGAQKNLQWLPYSTMARLRGRKIAHAGLVSVPAIEFARDASPLSQLMLKFCDGTNAFIPTQSQIAESKRTGKYAHTAKHRADNNGRRDRTNGPTKRRQQPAAAASNRGNQAKHRRAAILSMPQTA